jgi:hypothetical protein
VSPFDVMATALPWLVLVELDTQYRQLIRPRLTLTQMSLALLSGFFFANRFKGMKDSRLSRSTV